MCFPMINPVLTILFDIFIIGSGLAIVAGLIAEHRANRIPAIGSGLGARKGQRTLLEPSQISQYQARRRPTQRRVVA